MVLDRAKRLFSRFSFIKIRIGLYYHRLHNHYPWWGTFATAFVIIALAFMGIPNFQKLNHVYFINEYSVDRIALQNESWFDQIEFDLESPFPLAIKMI